MPGWIRPSILLSWAAAACHGACPAVFNVRDFGAVGDGVTDDSSPIRAAAAALAACGVGDLTFPAGYAFLTGAFNLSSNARMCVCGTVLGSQSSGGYPVIPPLPWYGGGCDFQQSGAPEYQALIHSAYADNVTLSACDSDCGPGAVHVVDGQGAPWWDCVGKPAAPCAGISRPPLVRLTHAQGVLIEGITFKNSPSWNLHLANVTHGHVINVTVLAPASSHNTDGFDIDCSVDVLVEQSTYSGGDDAVAIKSGIDYLGRTFGRTTQDVVVRDMTIGTTHGLSIGSEMSAGVANVSFYNVVMNGSSIAARVKSVRGRGGVVRDISYSNIIASNVDQAIVLTLAYKSNVPPTNASATPVFENISITNMTVNGAQDGYILQGLNDSTIRNVTLAGVRMTGVNKYISVDEYTSGTCTDVSPSCPSLLPPQ